MYSASISHPLLSSIWFDVLSLLTQISFRKWSNNTVYSVILQSHSFSSTNVMLSPSFTQTNYNTPTGESPLNPSAFTISTVTYDENTPPLKRDDTSGGTQEVCCTWCNTMSNMGRTMQTHYTFCLFTMNMVILLGGWGKKLLIIFHLNLKFLSHLFNYQYHYISTHILIPLMSFFKILYMYKVNA